MLLDRRLGRLARAGLRQHRVRASRVGRGWAWSCAWACQAGALAVAEPAQEPDGSAAAGALPCRGAEAPRDARPAVQRDSGAAADARAFQELATPGAQTPGVQTAATQPFRSETGKPAAQCGLLAHVEA